MFNEENILGSLASPPFVDLSQVPYPNASRSGFSDWILGVAPDQGERFANALSTGLRIAQDWNKPRPAVSASGSGTGADGSTYEQHPYQKGIDTLDRAIDAPRTGDMDPFRRAMNELFPARAGSAARADAQRVARMGIGSEPDVGGSGDSRATSFTTSTCTSRRLRMAARS